MAKRTRGGHKLKAFLRQAKQAQARSAGVDVGFFESARYPDGTPVALVAAVHEFGTEDGRIPERPSFRTAISSTQHAMRDVLRRGIDPKTLTLDETTAREVGGVLADGLRANLEVDPPLRDTGKLIAAVDVRVSPARRR